MPRRRTDPGNTPSMISFCRHCAEGYPTGSTGMEGVCPDCLAEFYEECPECGRHWHSELVIEVEGSGRRMCRECAQREGYRCLDCGEWHDDPGTTVQGGRIVCPSCSRRYLRCAECGTMVPEEDATSDGRDTLCWGCRAARRGRPIHPYSYKPRPLFRKAQGEGDGSLVLGIELEMDGVDPLPAIARIQERYGEEWFYFKHDSSLGSGAELVTHPISPFVLFGDEGREMWSHVCRSAVQEGLRSHDTNTCGLHVHVNRDFFGEGGVARVMAESKMIEVFSRFHEPLAIFSRRRPEQLAHWARRSEVPTCSGGWLEQARLSSEHAHRMRYLDVNVLNAATIEVRMFRGTLKTGTLLATLQFVAGLCCVLKAHNPSQLGRMTWYDLCDAVLENCPCGAPELEAYLIEKELIVERSSKCA